MVRNLGQRIVVDHELAEPQRATRDDGLRAYVPGDFVAPHELGRELTEQVGACERSGEQDFGVAVAVVELERDDEFFARDRLGVSKRRAAAVRERVTR